MRIGFMDETHTYIVDGDIASISVTELLHKHGLAPSYKGVPKEVLAKASERGTAIHKDIEGCLNKRNYEVQTPEGAEFEKWIDENATCAVAEQKLAYDYKGMIIAGTCDVMGELRSGGFFIGDHKTTSSFNHEYVRWQVSIYNYFARQSSGEKINGKVINWKGAQKFFGFHYIDGKLSVKELEPIPDEYIEQLFDCEYRGVAFVRPELTISDDLKHGVELAEQVLLGAQASYEKAKEKADKLRAELQAEMERQGVRTWETDKVRVTYIPQTDRMSIDSKRLKEEHPRIYAEYQKISKVSAQIRIKVKNELLLETEESGGEEI